MGGNMKKVLVYGISGGPGGVETVVHNIIVNSDKEKISFDILTFFDNIEYANEYKELGVNVYKITARSENPVKNKQELESAINSIRATKGVTSVYRSER